MSPIIRYNLPTGWVLELRVIEPPGRTPGDFKYDTQWWVTSESASVLVSETTALAILTNMQGRRL